MVEFEGKKIKHVFLIIFNNKKPIFYVDGTGLQFSKESIIDNRILFGAIESLNDYLTKIGIFGNSLLFPSIDDLWGIICFTIESMDAPFFLVKGTINRAVEIFSNV